MQPETFLSPIICDCAISPWIRYLSTFLSGLVHPNPPPFSSPVVCRWTCLSSTYFSLPPPPPPHCGWVLSLRRSARCMVIVGALGQARVLLRDPDNSPNTFSFRVIVTLSWPAVRKLLRIGVHPVWGNGQGLIVVAAYLNNLAKKNTHGNGSRRGLICNLFVSHPHAKVRKPSTEVCMHHTASLHIQQQ